MQGDFSRDTFDPLKGFRRVLMQQGRVMLDADFNEQTAILLHYLQALAADLIGWHGGPGDAFKIEPGEANDFTITPGHYYVEGVLADSTDPRNEDRNPIKYSEQRCLKPDDGETLSNLANGRPLLVYLDLWERHISYVEDAVHDQPTVPGIREVALGGPDTAGRSRLIWQVKCVPIEATEETSSLAENIQKLDKAKAFRDRFTPDRTTFHMPEPPAGKPPPGTLAARTYSGSSDSNDPCIIPPEAGYRGADNRLYRVEIHRPGNATAETATDNGPTFKWSRENGSVIFPLRPKITIDKEVITAQLASLGRDARSSLQQGDYVEILDDTLVLRNERGPICQVKEIDLQARTVVLSKPTDPSIDLSGFAKMEKHSILRRWDHRPNQSPPTPTVLNKEDNALNLNVGNWLTLEDGIQIQFGAGEYRSGDYWLIPARVATGQVEWPLNTDKEPVPLPPHGVRHYYAPLAVITVGTVQEITVEGDCRRTFNQLWSKAS